MRTPRLEKSFPVHSIVTCTGKLLFYDFLLVYCLYDIWQNFSGYSLISKADFRRQSGGCSQKIQHSRWANQQGSLPGCNADRTLHRV